MTNRKGSTRNDIAGERTQNQQERGTKEYEQHDHQTFSGAGAEKRGGTGPGGVSESAGKRNETEEGTSSEETEEEDEGIVEEETGTGAVESAEMMVVVVCVIVVVVVLFAYDSLTRSAVAMSSTNACRRGD